MKAFRFSRFSRLCVGAAALAAVVVLFFAVSLLTAQTVQAASGPTCFEQMNSPLAKVIVFNASVYTETIRAGTDVCVESEADLTLGFIGDSPFAIDGSGASTGKAGGFLFALGPVSGILPYNLDAGTTLKLELTAAVGSKATLWLGTLNTAPATVPTPAPAATSTAMVIVGPGPLAKGTLPEWGEFTPITQTMSIEVQARVSFTMTAASGTVEAGSCGVSCWKATWEIAPGEGKIKASELRGLWWSATLVGEPTARVLMPATVRTTAPAPGTQYKDADGNCRASNAKGAAVVACSGGPTLPFTVAISPSDLPIEYEENLTLPLGAWLFSR